MIYEDGFEFTGLSKLGLLFILMGEIDQLSPTIVPLLEISSYLYIIYSFAANTDSIIHLYVFILYYLKKIINIFLNI